MSTSTVELVPMLARPPGWQLLRPGDGSVATLADHLQRLVPAGRAGREVIAETIPTFGELFTRTDLRAVIVPALEEPLPMAVVVRELTGTVEEMDARIRAAVTEHGGDALEADETILRWVVREDVETARVDTFRYLSIRPGSGRAAAALVEAVVISAQDATDVRAGLGEVADTMASSLAWLTLADALAAEDAMNSSEGEARG